MCVKFVDLLKLKTYINNCLLKLKTVQIHPENVYLACSNLKYPWQHLQTRLNAA